MKLFLFVPCFLLFSGITFGQPTSNFSRAEVLADFEYLYNSLEEAHYDLYAYTKKEEFARAYRELKASVTADSLSLLETTILYQRFVALAKNGHTNIPFPAASYIKYAYAGGKVFPLELALEEGKALVRKNWSGNTNIEAGAELLSINGTPIADILSRIYPVISAERPYFKGVKVEYWSFPRLYWQVFGAQEAFTVTIRQGESVTKLTLPAVDAIEGYEMKRTEVVNATMSYSFLPEGAYLNPGGFSGDEATYRHFIDSAFAAIHARGSERLIIDLRNNPGGEDAFSDYLVSYIADKPFTWNARFTLKTSAFLKEHVRAERDTTLPYWQAVLEHDDGEVYDYSFAPYPPQPIEQRFKGDVYVLVNRQSHSQSTVTAAQIQDYGFGTIVGEETGDYPSLFASVFQYSLPRTGILVSVSKGYMVRVNGSTAPEGVIPDIEIKDHLLDEHDEILQGLLQRLGRL